MFNTSADTRVEYAPGDPLLIKNIVSQLKSQGVFDQFRKECISDVDTKPAYQNLCHRVDGRVESYLFDVKWGPDLNKNQLRENIRKHVNECNFVESGISRIVDQLVNPRINTVLVPKVEDIVYTYLGIERTENVESQINGSVPEKTKIPAENQKERGSIIKSENCNITCNRRTVSSCNQPSEFASNKDFSYDLKNGIQQETIVPAISDSINRSSVDACSDIDSDEDDMSPPFEPHEKSDVELSAESDYSMDISDTKYDIKSEPSGTPKLDADNDRIFRNLERICGEESMDSISSSCTDRINSRKPSLSLDLPKTPTINYETSDESQDNCSKQNNSANVRRESSQNEICVPDTSSMDSLVEKIAEDNREDPTTTIEDACSVLKMKSRDEKTISNKHKEREDIDQNKHKRSETKSSDLKDSKHRDRKHSDHKKDKDRKPDKHESSKNEKDRKSSRDKDRSNYDSKNRTSKEKSDQSRDRKDHNKDSSRTESDKSKSQKSHSDEKLLKDRDSKHKESTKSSSSSDKHRSSDDKNKSSRAKVDDSKDDRKKKSSSSKHDSEKDRERSKHRKEESSDLKKSKTQCSTDENKVRSDRRSSDRDSNGPSSSSRSSAYRSSSKTDKEKCSEKHRHSSSSTSSSSSSSHKNKKNAETKDNGRADELLSKMMSVTGSMSTSCETVPHTKASDIENTSCLLDILNDHDEMKTSRPNSNLCDNESRKSSFVADTEENVKHENGEGCKNNEDGQDQKADGFSTRKEIKEPIILKNFSLDGETLNVEIADMETKKPKIAKNAADILRIMELRKQYKEKVKSEQLMQQQGKENANLKGRKGSSSDEYDQKSILGERSADNYIANKYGKHEKNVVDAQAELADSAMDAFSDFKLKIRRIDSDYRLINGTCVIGNVENEQILSNNNDVSVNNNNAGNTNEDLIECSVMNEKHLKQMAQLQLKDMKVNGSLKDCVKLKIDVMDTANSNLHVTNETDSARDTNETKEIPITMKNCLREEIDDVHYLEPTELNMDFKNFVAKRIKESEEMYLENFSIHLRCPERYDYIFRNQLGAIVKRKCGKAETLTSPFKYNSEIINNKVGNEKGIMMRIKKTVHGNETLSERSFGVGNMTAVYPDGAQNQLTCAVNAAGDRLDNAVANFSNNSNSKITSIKRKMLGIKRCLSNNSKVVGETATKVTKLNNTNTNGLLAAEKPHISLLGSQAADTERGKTESCSGAYENNQLSRLSTPDNQKNIVVNTSTVHSSGQPAPKIPRRISEESKRKQFYYDEGDLYKPRPSFLVSSRRSRGLNTDKV